MKAFVILLLLATVLSAQQIQIPPVRFAGPTGPNGPFPFFNSGTITLASDADYTMVYPDISASVIRITTGVGVSLTAARNIIGPTAAAPFFGFEFTIENATAGGQSLVITTAAGTPGVTIPNGQAMMVIYDGTRYVGVGSASGGGGAGPIVSPLVVPSVDGANNFTVTVPNSGGGNPTLSSSTGTINIANLFVTDLAGTGTSILQTDALGNVGRVAPVASTYVLAGPPLGGAITGSPTVVQWRSCVPGGNGTAPLTCTFVGPTAAGNLIIVAPQRWIPYASAPALSVTDNLGQTYLSTPDFPITPVAYKENTAAGVTSISTNYSNGGALSIFEVNNIATSNSYDADIYNVANLPGPPILWEQLTTSNPSDFIFGYWTCPVNSTTAPTSVPPWNLGGYTPAASNGWSTGWVWQNVLQIGTYRPQVATADCTQTPTAPNVYAVAFKASLLASAGPLAPRPLQSNDLPPTQWSALTNPSPNYLTQLDMNTGATFLNWNVAATNSNFDWGFGLVLSDTSTINPTCFVQPGTTEVEPRCRTMLYSLASQAGVWPFEADSFAAPSSTGYPSGFHVSGATGDIVMQGSAGIMLPNPGGQIVSVGNITSDSAMNAPVFNVCTAANPCTTPTPTIAPLGNAAQVKRDVHSIGHLTVPVTAPTPRLGGGEPLASVHLHDFSPTVAANGQVPIWNSTLHQYVPGPMTGGGGGGAGIGACAANQYANATTAGAPTCAQVQYSQLGGTVTTWNQNTTGSAARLSGGALGSIPYQSGAGTTAFIAGNTTTTDRVLVSTGTGSATQAPFLSNAPTLSAANMTGFPILNQNTTGTAAGITGNGLANQVWGMDAAGTTQGWQTPSGGGGSVAINDLTGATNAGFILNGANQMTWNWAFGSNTSLSGLRLSETASSGSSNYLLNISTSVGSNTGPFRATSRGGFNGLQIDPATGNITTIGTAKLVGPLQLPSPLSAACLGTDASGNIQTGTCSGGTGSTSWSSLTAPTASLPLNMGAQTSVFSFNSGNGLSLPMWQFLDSASASIVASPFLRIQTNAANTLEDPMAVTSGSTNGLAVAGGTGNIKATGTAKFVGPLQLPSPLGAACLGTDASGNVQAGTCSGGGGGPVSISALTNATAEGYTNNGDLQLWWEWNSSLLQGASRDSLALADTAVSDPQFSGGSILGIYSAGNFRNLLDLEAGSGRGWVVDGTGDLNSVYGAVISSPVQLTTGSDSTGLPLPVVNAASLGTDANGNIIPRANPNTPLWAPVFTGLGFAANGATGTIPPPAGLNAPGCSGGICTMTMPAEDGTYRFTYEIVLTAAGQNCTAGSVQPVITYTNPDNNATTLWAAPTRALTSNAIVSTVPLGTAALGQSSIYTGVASEFRVKQGFAITVRMSQNVAPAACTVSPTYTFRPALYGPLGY